MVVNTVSKSTVSTENDNLFEEKSWSFLQLEIKAESVSNTRKGSI
jgi:hypothetical protein